jgi:hypothetical protein
VFFVSEVATRRSDSANWLWAYRPAGLVFCVSHISRCATGIDPNGINRVVDDFEDAKSPEFNKAQPLSTSREPSQTDLPPLWLHYGSSEGCANPTMPL